MSDPTDLAAAARSLHAAWQAGDVALLEGVSARARFDWPDEPGCGLEGALAASRGLPPVRLVEVLVRRNVAFIAWEMEDFAGPGARARRGSATASFDQEGRLVHLSLHFPQ